MVVLWLMDILEVQVGLIIFVQFKLEPLLIVLRQDYGLHMVTGMLAVVNCYAK